MKKRYLALLLLLAGTLFFGIGVGQGVAANTNNGHKPSPKDGLHRDGSAFVKEGTITQADRNAAADRAKAKGFVVGEGVAPSTSGINTPTDGAKK